MDGVVAYILGKSYTKKSLIGIGALAGAPCQVQSIEKVDKTTTITLKWEDTEGGVHTQSFDILDGEDGVSVVDATITPNGHLNLTLSDGNVIDCGKVLPQYDTMPSPSAINKGQILQYIGDTNINYTNGYFYKCVEDGGIYRWERTNVQPMPVTSVNGKTGDVVLNANDVHAQEIIQYTIMPTASIDYLNKIYQYIGATDVNYTNGYFYRCQFNSGTSTYEWVVANRFALADDVYTKTEIGDLSNLPHNADDVVENIIFINNEVNKKQDILQYSVLPTPSSENVGKIVEYIGTTTSNYTNGYFYQSKFDGTNYNWVQKDIQPSGGGTGSDNVVEGYFNPLNNLFYEEIAYINPIAGENNVIYISLDTNLLYRYNGLIFIRVDETNSGQTIQVNEMPTASIDELGKIYQFVGTTTASYTNGYFYKCIDNGGVYSWERINTQDSYTKSEIGNLNNLPDNTKNVVENISDLNNNKEPIFRYNNVSNIPVASASNEGQVIQYIGSTVPNYNSGYFYKSTLNTDTSTYEWKNIEVQPASGGSAVDSVNGEVGDVWLDSTDIGFQYATMPTTLNATDVGRIVQYIGATNSTYTNGRFYKCIDNSGTYSWQAIEVQPQITVDSSLSNISENPVQNKVIYNALEGKVNVEAGKGLSTNDYTNTDKNIVNNITTNLANKADKVEDATNNNFATLDSNGNLKDSGISKEIVPTNASSSNLLVTTSDISSLTDKADKVPNAVVNDFATLDANGNLLDSGINTNIVPSNASSSNKLITATDISSLSDKANKVPLATNGNFATLDSSGDLADSGISKYVVPTNATENNKLVTASDISTLTNKADKVSPVTADDIAMLDVNGNLADSGINTNIFPSNATSSNKLSTINDIPTELNDLSDDVVITSPQNAQILAYNSTSGKWENQTGQSVIGGAVFKGSILFANVPTTGMENGDWYDIKDEFTTDNRFEEGSGISCAAGTDIIWVANDSKWNILTPSGVYSFNGRTGAVLPASGDYSKSDVGLGNVVNTGDSDTPVSGGTTKFTTGGAYTELNKKADKVSDAINGHFAGLDSNGNLKDSGKGASDFATPSDLTNFYSTSDNAETTIADNDYVPFYSTNSTAKRKSLWSNIKSVLKTYFDDIYSTVKTSKSAVSGGEDLSLVTTGEKYIWNNKADNTQTFTQASSRTNISSGETLSTLFGKIMKWFADLKDLAFIAKPTSEIQTTTYLRGDGTWVTPPNTTYNVVSKTENGLAPQLPNETTTTKFLRQDGSWEVPNYPTVPSAYTSNPEMNGTASAGTSSYWSKGDHVHPTDTSRASATDLSSHINNTSNPHSVTATQVGLGNVVNTGDSATPISGGTTKFTTGGAYTELNKKQDADDKMNASDMTDVLTPLPSARGNWVEYSTTEHRIGTWIDNKPIYEKTVDCGQLPNNTTKEVDHNISDLKNVIHIEGIAWVSDSPTPIGSGWLPLPLVMTNSVGNSIMLVANTTKIRIGSSSNKSDYTKSYVTLQYTKTTD